MSQQKSHVAPPASESMAAGLGESFSINLNTGQGVYTQKIAIPEGVAGHHPGLQLEYASSNRHSAFGWGWKLQMRSIERRLETENSATSEKYLDSGQELLKMSDGTFKPKFEKSFDKYERTTDGYIIHERNGKKLHFGTTADSRIFDADNPERIHKWLLKKSVDTSGNEITYQYLKDEGEAYLKTIKYATYRITFEYETREDVRLISYMGFAVKRKLRCSRIVIELKERNTFTPLKHWDFAYQMSRSAKVSLLKSIQLTGLGDTGDGSDDIALPPATFSYTGDTQTETITTVIQPEVGSSEPPPLNDPDVNLINMENAPLPGVLMVRNGEQWYWKNNGKGNWRGPVKINKTPFIDSFQESGVFFLDADSSGLADMMVAGDHALHGFYENKGNGEWNNFVAYPRSSKATPDWSGQIAFDDLNKNGVIDVLESYKRSFGVWNNKGKKGWDSPVMTRKEDPALQTIDLSSPTTQLVDMTGDGNKDLVRIQSGRIEYWQSLGRGNFGQRVLMHNSPRLRKLTEKTNQVFLIDLNQSGCADLIVFHDDHLEIFYNENGQAFSEPHIVNGIFPAIAETIRPIDFFGTGATGFIYNTLGGKYVFVELQDRLPAFLLTHTENGFGLKAEIQYSAAIDFFLKDREVRKTWTGHFPFPLTVVSKTIETDTITGQESAVSLIYHEAHYEAGKRQFCGFKKVDRIEHGDESRPGKFTAHHFHCGVELEPEKGPEHAALNGLLYRKELFSYRNEEPSEKPVNVEEASYDITELTAAEDGTKRYFIHVTSSGQHQFEETDDVKSVVTTYDYDALGNVVKQVKTGGGMLDGNPVDKLIIETALEYAVNEDKWIIDRIAKKVEKDQDGNLLSEVRIFYDGDDFVGLPAGQVERGLKSRQEVYVRDAATLRQHYQGLNIEQLGYTIDQDANGDQAVFLQQERFKHDEKGLRTGSMDPLGNEEEFVFDSSGLFRIEYKSALGKTSYQYNKKRFKASRIRNVDGTELRMTFDAMDRIVDVFNPDNQSAVPSRSYEYSDSELPVRRTTKYYLTEDLNNFTSIHCYFDGRLKDVQKRVEEEPGTFIVSAFQEKNPFGDIKREFEPFKSNSKDFAIPDLTTLNKQEFFFDTSGRPVLTKNFFGGESTAEYQPFTIVTRDAVSNDNSPENVASGKFGLRKIETINPFNHRVSTVREAEGGNKISLFYTLDLLGDLVEIQDDLGIKATYVMDRAGNRLTVDHREAGLRKVCYNAAGQPVRGVDANGNVITSEYESGTSRIKKLFNNGELKEEYFYDVTTQSAKAKLAEVRYEGGSQKMFYDNAGRLKRKAYKFDGIADPDTISYGFDRIGRQISITHTDGTVIEHQLSPNGWVKAIAGAVDQIKYDAFGNPVEISYSNGVITERAYTPGSRKIRLQKTTKGNQTFEDLLYDYDHNGNLIRITDQTTGQVNTTDLTYDSFEQLINSSTTDGGGDFGYQYDNLMNLSRIGETGKELQHNDPAKPHRLTQISENLDTFNVIYDDNGNITRLPGKSFTFNYKNELVRCDFSAGGHSTYQYDHLSKRTQKEVSIDGVTVRTRFIEDLAEYRNNTKAYFLNIGKVRLGIIVDGTLRLVHNNYLGSTSFFTDSAGTKISSIAYKPYGNVLSSSGNPGHTTFATHPFDEETGLFYMQKRYYSPEIGRFLSTDLVAVYQPKKIIGDPVAMHPYAYTGNNPVNNIDLEGTSFWSVIGGIVGVIVAVVAVLTLGIVGALVLGLGLVAASYFLADANVGNDFGEFMRGFMIGFNAGMNFMIGSALFGPLIGTALGVINFLAVDETLTQNPVFEGILGWASWLMPMSWLVTGLGLLFFVINLIVAGVTLNMVPEVAITSINVDWRRGMINMEGGAIRAAGAGAAFNMGNFSFYDPGALGVAEHEIGHGLNLAAFGWAFHYIGAIDQAADPNFGGAGGVYAEDLAEGSMPTPRFGRPGLDMWAN